jgi:transposase
MVIKKRDSSKQTGKRGKTGKLPKARHVYRRDGRPYPLDFRIKAVKAVLGCGGEIADVARAVGVSSGTLSSWVVRYQTHGRDGLVPVRQRADAKERSKRADTPQRRAVKQAKQTHPDYGTRRIRDELARDEGIGVSEALVRRKVRARMPTASAAAAPLASSAEPQPPAVEQRRAPSPQPPIGVVVETPPF